MKNGIYQEGDHLVYYKDDKPNITVTAREN